ncbi:MarR family transcriptional regulator [Gordonia sp. NB41Y]|uniref:MarR family winged helix-turn-helix transcriptional regulator n=1 Tax=Gordonia sp. NB41Y TaxID=875808 RepID=UPI0002BE3457|nr:MarR family transcriptional regulator [Gordonia sp. NB41Y]EMP14014.1 MarR family transcriptional regulator [Gordonia sp. NB41Y]WLP88698.1 MarR family transcriptional regulator [Gordonia sp. NB41Y]
MDERVDQLRDDIVRFNRRIRTKNAGRHLLTPTQVQALAHVDRLGPMSARALADAEMVAPQTVARTVAYLEQQGLVTRHPDPDDARAALISITDVGHQTLEADRSTRNEWLAEAISTHCTPVERDLLFLAGSLLRRIAEDTPADDVTGAAR